MLHLIERRPGARQLLAQLLVKTQNPLHLFGQLFEELVNTVFFIADGPGLELLLLDIDRRNSHKSVLS